ncbi:hypothetical protein JW968_06210 [Candidatus Woesearchaeota archaeon]|nr:hypothetical protein [Candidatus Woesearchaeota archaeon]
MYFYPLDLPSYGFDFGNFAPAVAVRNPVPPSPLEQRMVFQLENELVNIAAYHQPLKKLHEIA